MQRRELRWGWLALAIAAAAVLTYVTFIGSVGISCGAYDSGPNPGAEEAWCGYGSGDPEGYNIGFVLVQLVPAIPVLAAGVMASIGRSRLFAPAGLALGVLTMLLIWSLEP